MPKRKTFDSDDSGEEDDTLFKAYGEGGELDEDLLASDVDSNDLVDDDDEDEDDDDGAPEDVNFKESKQAVLDTVRRAMNQIGQQKQSEKEKRKKKQDKFSAQKKEKFDALNKMRLPDDVLDSLEEKPLKKKKEAAEFMEEEEEEEEDEEEEDEDFDGIHMSAEDIAAHLGSSDFIPLESGEIGVKAVCLNEEMRKPRSSMQKALDFRNNRFNSKHIPRQSSKSMIIKKQKTRIRNQLLNRV